MKQKCSFIDNHIMNLLVDYYTEIPFRPYGSGATRENVVPFLKELDLGYVCIYVKGHGGYTTWRSSLRTEHVMLDKDMPRFFRDATREAGCRLVLYYSGLLDGIAGLRHPEWVMQHPNGSPKQVYGDFKSFLSYGICPQSDYFDQWVSVHLRELVEAYEPDGFWVDGDWPGPCYCPRCQETFRQATGWKESWQAVKWDAAGSGPLPSVSGYDDFAADYKTVWNRTEAAWRERFCHYIKELKPDCIYSAGNVSPRREFAAPFDWRSGDFFSPGSFRLNDMARMMRWYGTLDAPADAYVCDTSFTHVRKSVRSRSKTVQRMMQEAATVATAGGKVGYWTFPLGNGAFVPSRMRKAIAVRKFLRERESLFLDSVPMPWTAVVVPDPSVPALGNSAINGAHQVLAALHRSPQVMDETGLSETIEHDLLVLPEQGHMTDATVSLLTQFVERGGTILSSGATIRSMTYRALLGVTDVTYGALTDGHVILKDEPFGEPTGLDSTWDRLELGDAEELYPLYHSWDQFNPECRNLDNNWPMHGLLDEENPEPAGMPAAVSRKLGKGQIVHIATDIFARYCELGDPQMLRWLREIVDSLQPRPLFETDAPSWVDITLRKRGKHTLIHFVNQNPGRDVAKLNCNDCWVDEIPEVAPLACQLRDSRDPKYVTWKPEGLGVPFVRKNGIIRFETPVFHIHGCITVEWQD